MRESATDSTTPPTTARVRYPVMQRKILSFVFVLTSLVIGLGAFGHAAQWWRIVYPALGNRVSDHRMLNMLLAVWLFVSGSMLGFGLVLIWTWWRIRKADHGVFVIPIGIAVFYFIFGLLSWIYVGSFFALFVVLSILLFISTLGLNARASDRANRPISNSRPRVV
jgi:hypothetical protein